MGASFNSIQLFGGALGHGIEPARAVQNIAEQVQPNRPAFTRRVDVDDAAADRIIAGLGHGGRLGKPHAHQKIAQPGLVDTAAHASGKAGARHDLAGDALQHRVQRRQQHEWPLDRPLRQPGQGRHPRRLHLGGGGYAIIGGGVPGREVQHRQPRRQKFQRGAGGGHAPIVAGDMDHGLAPRRLARDQGGVIAFWGSGQDQLLGHERSVKRG